MIIEKSNELGELFKALSKLQAEVEQPKKDQVGYASKYKFADLSQYIDLSKGVLEKYGLSVTQLPGEVEVVEVTNENITKDNKGYVISKHYETIKMPKQKLYTVLGHSSGQYIISCMEILVEKLAGMSWGQSIGSAISYGRRYSRAASLSMCQEDNDNQNVSKKQEENQVSYNNPPPKITNEQAVQLRNLIKHDIHMYFERMQKAYGVAKIEDLTQIQFMKIMDQLRVEGLADKQIEKKVA